MSSQAGGEQGSEVVLRLTGDLDFRVIDTTRAALLQALAQTWKCLIVDLSEVDFIDSSGLAILSEAARHADRNGMRVRLQGLHPHHVRLLHTIGLVGRFEIEAAPSRNGSAPLRQEGTGASGETQRFPGEPASVPLIRNYVGALAQEFGFPEGGVRDILSAVSEAATNALKHGSPLGPENQISVCCRVESDRLIIEVMDQGGGFDPLAVPVPVAEQMREGGMGIFFMRALMDEVSFDCSAGGTTVRLVKCRT